MIGLVSYILPLASRASEWLLHASISGERGTLAVLSDQPEVIWLRSGPTLTKYATWKTDLPEQKLPTDFLYRGAPPTPGAIVHAIRGSKVDYPTFADGVRAFWALPCSD